MPLSISLPALYKYNWGGGTPKPLFIVSISFSLSWKCICFSRTHFGSSVNLTGTISIRQLLPAQTSFEISPSLLWASAETDEGEFLQFSRGIVVQLRGNVWYTISLLKGSFVHLNSTLMLWSFWSPKKIVQSHYWLYFWIIFEGSLAFLNFSIFYN